SSNTGSKTSSGDAGGCVSPTQPTACERSCSHSSIVYQAAGRADAWRIPDAMNSGSSTARESAYVVPGELSTEAITRNLLALLPTRRHPIAKHRFTVLDTVDGRVRQAGACLTRTGADGASTVKWQTLVGSDRYAIRMTRPVSFAWDLPDGPLREQV